MLGLGTQWATANGEEGCFFIRALAVLICTLLLVNFRALANSPTPHPPINGNLSREDVLILDQGEISTVRYLSGGLVGSLVGFGSGHAIQGRFQNKGFFFLAADAAAFGAFMGGSLLACGIQGQTSDTDACRIAQYAGVTAIVSLRLWEFYDLWFIPPKENERYRELTNKRQSSSIELRPYLAPLSSNSIAAGVGISF